MFCSLLGVSTRFVEDCDFGQIVWKPSVLTVCPSIAEVIEFATPNRSAVHLRVLRQNTGPGGTGPAASTCCPKGGPGRYPARVAYRTVRIRHPENARANTLLPA